MSEVKKKVEAVLFSTGRFMTVEEVAEILELKNDTVRENLEELEREYKEKESALTVQSHDDKYKLNIRKEYGYITNRLVSSTEMDSPTTKTLAVIAFKSPALQSDVIKIRGNKAYDHITTLKEQGLVTAEKHGRTRLLKLSEKFYDYFDTAQPDIKEKFEEIKEKYKETLEALDEESAQESEENEEKPKICVPGEECEEEEQNTKVEVVEDEECGEETPEQENSEEENQ